jgi:hypothetical protein
MAITTNGGAGVTADAVATLSNKTLAAPVITGGVGITGTTTIAGDLTVTGTTTNINTTNLVVEDKNIVLADVTTPTDVTADGGGITLKGATDKSINWVDATDAWTSSEDFNLLTGKTYEIAGTVVLSSTQVLGKSVPSGTIVGTDDSQTLTNKTLTSPVISTISNTGTLTLPTATGTLALTTDIPSGVVTETGTQTLTNKTLTAPIITGAIFNDGSVVFEGTTANDFETTLAITDPTADRTITFPDSTGTVALTSGVINNTLTTTTGDIIYASGANTPARLAIGTAGQTLVVGAGGIPEWGAAASGGVSANDQAFAFAVQVFA